MTAKLFPFRLEHWFGDKLGKISNFPCIINENCFWSWLNLSIQRRIFRLFFCSFANLKSWSKDDIFLGQKSLSLLDTNTHIFRLAGSSSIVVSDYCWPNHLIFYAHFPGFYLAEQLHVFWRYMSKIMLIKEGKILIFFKVFVFCKVKQKHFE